VGPLPSGGIRGGFIVNINSNTIYVRMFIANVDFSPCFIPFLFSSSFSPKDMALIYIDYKIMIVCFTNVC